MKNKALVYSLGLALVVVAAALYVATYLDRAFMKFFYSKCGYYLIWLLFLMWVVQLCRCWTHYKVSAKGFLQSYGAGLAVCLGICALIFISVPPYFRVLGDEVYLLSMSKCMVWDRTTDYFTTSMWYFDDIFPEARGSNYRPLLFPFLGALAHIFTGFRPENLFAVNFACLFALLSLVYWQAKKWTGNALWAMAAVFFTLAQPVIAVMSTSGAFDLLSTLFLVISLINLRWFLDKPEPLRFELLFLNVLMMANSRSECALFSAIIMLALLAFKYVKTDLFKTEGVLFYCATPLVALLLYCPKLLVGNAFYDFNGNLYNGPIFALKFLRENTKIFWNSLFRWDFYLPYNSIANVLGVAGLVYLTYVFVRKRSALRPQTRQLVYISAACVFVAWLVYAAFYGGACDTAYSVRHYAIVMMAISLAGLGLLYAVPAIRRRPWLALLLSVTVFTIYHAVTVNDRMTRWVNADRELRYTTDFLKKETAKSRHFVVLAESNYYYAGLGYATMGIDYANGSRLARDLRERLFENVFVFQNVNGTTGETKQKIGPNCTLKTLREYKLDGVNFIRISKIVAIQDAGGSWQALPD